MERGLPEKLVVHGAGVILAGMVAGFAYAFVVTGDLAGSERAWRMAHLEGVLNGLVLLAVAGIADRLALSARAATMLAWSLIVTAWGNVVAAVIGATLGVRGLTPGGSLGNTIVYALFMIAVVGILVALVLVAIGARTAAKEA